MHESIRKSPKGAARRLSLLPALLICCVWGACNEQPATEDRPNPRPRPAPITKSVRPGPSTPEGNWQQYCQRCHTRGQLAGHSADDIRSALQTIPTMRRLQGSFTDEEIAALAQLLASERANSDGDVPSADGGD